jgi:hypothetical protein
LFQSQEPTSSSKPSDDKSWSKSIGSLGSSKQKLAGLIVKKKPVPKAEVSASKIVRKLRLLLLVPLLH